MLEVSRDNYYLKVSCGGFLSFPDPSFFLPRIFRTIVTVYAMEDSLTDSVDNVEVPKSFVWRDNLLAKMREDIRGKFIPSLID